LMLPRGHWRLPTWPAEIPLSKTLFGLILPPSTVTYQSKLMCRRQTAEFPMKSFSLRWMDPLHILFLSFSRSIEHLSHSFFHMTFTWSCWQCKNSRRTLCWSFYTCGMRMPGIDRSWVQCPLVSHDVAGSRKRGNMLCIRGTLHFSFVHVY
jgi:hypothetical protein